jgi:hypothetical protein
MKPTNLLQNTHIILSVFVRMYTEYQNVRTEGLF